jgi:hypothetical protein
MSSSELVRWGGLAAMLAGVAFIVLLLIPVAFMLLKLHPDAAYPGSSFNVLGAVLFIAAWLLLVVGLAGFHALQEERYGLIGRTGFYTVIVGASAHVVAAVTQEVLGLTWESTALEFLAFLGLLVAMVGFVLYGAATLQARVLPRWCGVGFIVGLPVWRGIGMVSEYGGLLGGTVGWTLGGILFGLLWLALGYVLWSESGGAAEHPARAR